MKTRTMAAAVAAALAVTGVAYADTGNNHEQVTVAPRTYVAGYCGFPIYSEPERSQNFVLKRTTNPDGTVIEETRGQLIRTLTNTVTGKSIQVNISGPGSVTYFPDRSYVVEGSGGWIVLIPRRFGYDAPVMAVTSGKFTYAYDPNTDTLNWSGNGALRDICAELS
ncbi:MAG TPA: hypothetical protein VFZ00_15800 [Solirubrobacter sp.]|nr:hypothetical protein [Solirubrobacter sp.]